MPTAAVIGSGFIGQVHIEALQRIGVRVKALCGSDNARPVAAKFAIPDLHLDYDYRPILADPEIDVVHITSPNRFHHQASLDCIAAGKHVVCEKPLAMNSRETAEIVAAAKASDRVFAVNYNVRFYPLMLQLRKMIAAGELGRIIHVNGSYLQDWLLLDTDFNWRLLPDDGGKLRAVGDIGTHWMDLVSFVMGDRIAEVWAELQIHHQTRKRPTGPVQTFTTEADTSQYAPYPVETEDFANILLRFGCGAVGNLAVSQVAAGRMNCIRVEIYGTEKSIEWCSERPNEMLVSRRGSRNEVLHRDQSLLDPDILPYVDLPPGHNEGFGDTFKMLYRNVYAAIADRENTERFYADAAEGHHELAICDAILEANRTGQWTPVGAGRKTDRNQES